jgi:prepilin-type N-terminal cleavage/methylation domain-containing protein
MRLKVNHTVRTGFTLVEILIVVVIMAVMAAIVIPQFNNSTDDTRKATVQFNLSIVRSVIQTYRGQHGQMPFVNDVQDLAEVITNKTQTNGTIDNTNGIFGPYVDVFPENSFSNSISIKLITNDPATSSDVTSGGSGGWLYNKTTGGLWLDRDPGYEW